MSSVLGIVVLLAAMAYALFLLFTGMREGTFRYLGRRISRTDSPGIFWFCMAMMIVCLFLAARTLPRFLVQLA